MLCSKLLGTPRCRVAPEVDLNDDVGVGPAGVDVGDVDQVDGGRGGDDAILPGGRARENTPRKHPQMVYHPSNTYHLPFLLLSPVMPSNPF